MADIDWVIVPSIWWENSPLVIQEAFMHGRPVICSDIGGMAEKVRDGADGLHFRAGDPQSVADAIRRAASEPGLWQKLAGGIRPIYDIHEQVGLMESIYHELLERSAVAGGVS
jgi:glycosyltransferase involved in cell wall biosynthesis